jgi:ketosteroid isomerase-like protein
MQSVSTGREVIRDSMQRVFTMLYNGETMKTTVHTAISEGNLATIRFTLTGEFPNGGAYSNGYCVCVESRGDQIAKVWEYVDGGMPSCRCRQPASASPRLAGLDRRSGPVLR